MARPYIGIVGVKDVAESVGVAKMVRGTLSGTVPGGLHRVQLGLQVTRTTLNGEASSTSRRNPVATNIPEIFSAALAIRPDLFTVVHFTPKDPVIVSESVRKIFTLGNMYERKICRGIQLNGMFGKLDPQVISAIKSELPELEIILQIPGKVLAEKRPEDIANQSVAYGELVDYILIDPSGGRGQEMDVEAGTKLAGMIMEAGVSVGLAGGLRGGNVARIVTRARQLLGTNDFSIDAEGGLRDRVGDGYGNDDFNLFKAAIYFSEAFSALR